MVSTVHFKLNPLDELFKRKPELRFEYSIALKEASYVTLLPSEAYCQKIRGKQSTLALSISVTRV